MSSTEKPSVHASTAHVLPVRYATISLSKNFSHFTITWDPALIKTSATEDTDATRSRSKALRDFALRIALKNEAAGSDTDSRLEAIEHLTQCAQTYLPTLNRALKSEQVEFVSGHEFRQRGSDRESPESDDDSEENQLLRKRDRLLFVEQFCQTYPLSPADYCYAKVTEGGSKVSFLHRTRPDVLHDILTSELFVARLDQELEAVTSHSTSGQWTKASAEQAYKNTLKCVGAGSLYEAVFFLDKEPSFYTQGPASESESKFRSIAEDVKRSLRILQASSAAVLRSLTGFSTLSLNADDGSKVLRDSLGAEGSMADEELQREARIAEVVEDSCDGNDEYGLPDLG